MKKTDSSFEHFNAIADDYSERSNQWPWQSIRNFESRAVVKGLGDLSNKTVLEFGCGAGFYTKRCLDSGVTEITAIDQVPKMLEQIADHPRLLKICADAENLDLGHHFDVILMAGIIEFVESIEDLFAVARNHLKPGGRLVVLHPSTGMASSLYRLYHAKHGVQLKLFSVEQLRACALEQALTLSQSRWAGPLARVSIFHMTSNTSRFISEENHQMNAKRTPHLEKDFWEAKILEWDRSRYELGTAKTNPVLEWFASRSSQSIRMRLQTAIRLLAPRVANKTIVELGCGSGRAAAAFMDAGAARYVGIDISELAIADAQQRHSDHPQAGDMTFIAGTTRELDAFEPDVVMSLGLLDWLQGEDIAYIYNACPNADHLHTISEKRNSLQQLMHRFYVWMAYGHRTDTYVPHYHDTQTILSLMNEKQKEKAVIFRAPELSFGAFIATFEVPGSQPLKSLDT